MRALLLALLSVAACGRLHFDPHGVSGDDDADDASLDAPAAANLVFVTSTLQVAGTFGSLAAADAVCNMRAAEAGLGGSYVAWLSSAGANARDRIGTTARGWRLTDGRPFADRLDELVLDHWFYPITLDEHGDPQQFNFVATGTTYDGVYAGTGDCNGYTSTSASVLAASLLNGSSYWSGGGTISCDQMVRLFCFGTTESTPVVPDPIAVRRAFLSTTPWTPNGDLTGADAACQSDADAAGLGRTFLALLGTRTASPISRFDLGGLPWARLDDTLLADSAAALPASGLLTSLNLTSDGTYALAGPSAWLGAANLTSVGTVASTCDDWSTLASTGAQAGIANLGASAFNGSNTTCTSANTRIWCFEP
jgi:hypothetical protein